MKILLLNPWIDAEHEVARTLEKRGGALLLPADPTEAWQLLQLHGSSVDLAIIHRENREGSALEVMGLIKRFKEDPSQADLPYILTTEKWADADCAKHQETPHGANAYLIQPFSPQKLIDLIEAVTGQKLVEKTSLTSTTAAVKAPAFPPPPAPSSRSPAIPKNPFASNPFISDEASIPGIVLEDASQIFLASELGDGSDTSIKLEMPVVAPDEPTRKAAVPPPFTGVSPPSIPPQTFPTAPEGGEIAIALPEAPPSSPGETSESQTPDSIELSGNDGSGEIRIEVSGFEPPEPPSFLASAGASDGFSLPTAGGDDLEIPADAFQSAASEENAPVPQDDSPGGAEFQMEQGFELPSELSELQSSASAPADEPSLGEFDAEAVQEMPYLFKKKEKEEAASSPRDLRMIFAQPLGDAVVPGGAANAPDLETLKKFLLLREQDVGALSTQLKSAREQVGALEDELRKERARNVELTHKLEDQERRIENFEREKEDALVGLRAEIDDLNFKLKVKTDKAKILESKVRAATEEMERLKERVRADIRKIRVREKELENRLEIVKKDSEVLIAARENKVIELKRKLDLLEFNLDLLQDQYSREKEESAALREKLARAAQAMRVAGGMLDGDTETLDQEAS